MSTNNDHWRTRPVAGIGIVGLDHIAVTDSWMPDGKSTASRYFEAVGGPVPVALMTMARLGLEVPPLFYSVVGDDNAGDAVIRLLTEAGVDTRLMRRVPGAQTPHSVVVLNTASGTRALTNFAGSGLGDFVMPPRPIFQEVGLLHTDGRDYRTLKEVFFGCGAKRSLDLGSKRENGAGLLIDHDIVIASQVGGAAAFPDIAHDPIAQVRRLLSSGKSPAGVTLGANGVVIGSRDENGGNPVHLPAFSVPMVVDTCGAGDCFHGAFLWAYRAGQSALDAAQFAQAAVALRIQHYGSRAGLPTRFQAEAFLAENSR